MQTQTFCDGEGDVVNTLSPQEREAKLRMMEAHASQAQVLRAFSPISERFRSGKRYDFRQLPNGGRVLYENYDWGLRPRDWNRLVLAAYDEIAPREWKCH